MSFQMTCLTVDFTAAWNVAAMRSGFPDARRTAVHRVHRVQLFRLRTVRTIALVRLILARVRTTSGSAKLVRVGRVALDARRYSDGSQVDFLGRVGQTGPGESLRNGGIGRSGGELRHQIVQRGAVEPVARVLRKLLRVRTSEVSWQPRRRGRRCMRMVAGRMWLAAAAWSPGGLERVVASRVERTVISGCGLERQRRLHVGREAVLVHQVGQLLLIAGNGVQRGQVVTIGVHGGKASWSKLERNADRCLLRY